LLTKQQRNTEQGDVDMGSLFGGGDQSKKAIAPVTPAYTAEERMPTMSDASVQQAGLLAKQKSKTRSGARSTILSKALGGGKRTALGSIGNAGGGIYGRPMGDER
jgi:hypothetical protein